MTRIALTVDYGAKEYDTAREILASGRPSDYEYVDHFVYKWRWGDKRHDHAAVRSACERMRYDEVLHHLEKLRPKLSSMTSDVVMGAGTDQLRYLRDAVISQPSDSPRSIAVSVTCGGTTRQMLRRTGAGVSVRDVIRWIFDDAARLFGHWGAVDPKLTDMCVAYHGTDVDITVSYWV